MMMTAKKLGGHLMENEPMARYTSWRVGGLADRVYKPSSIEDVQAYLKSLPADEKVLWLGLGSNVLIRDGGIRGSVINTRGCLKQMFLSGLDGVYVEAGVPCAHVAKFAADNNLLNAEFLAGIPGTMGGALAMNAGAFGGETWGLVNKLVLVNRRGELMERKAGEFDVSYRHVLLAKDEWFVACYLTMPTGDNQQGREKIRELLAARAASQPTNKPSCGSVFKNPRGDYAARLIEVSGLKGKQMGAAQVSTKHANFILNTGNATASDIEQLMNHVKKTVLEQHGVDLETEVRVIGEVMA